MTHEEPLPEYRLPAALSVLSSPAEFYFIFFKITNRLVQTPFLTVACVSE
jgi:hypothetical protein